MSELPCKKCLVYALCQNKSIWELASECSRFRLYIQINPRDYSHPWTKKLKEFQTKGE